MLNGLEVAAMVSANRRSVGETWLEQIALLCKEINTGLAAISENAIQAFEESLWKQQMLCVGLKHLLPEVQTMEEGASLLLRIQESMSAMRDLNRTYAKVVQQAQASNGALLKLCCSYRTPDGRNLNGTTGMLCSMEA